MGELPRQPAGLMVGEVGDRTALAEVIEVGERVVDDRRVGEEVDAVEIGRVER